MTKLYIKNMVSLRCKLLVKAELEKLKINHHAVELGEVEVAGELSKAKQDALKIALLKAGLELMEDKRAIMVEKIKNTIVEMVHYTHSCQYSTIFLSKTINLSKSTGFTKKPWTDLEYASITCC